MLSPIPLALIPKEAKVEKYSYLLFLVHICHEYHLFEDSLILINCYLFLRCPDNEINI